ncbi:MAG: ABC transporter permease subunit, partial [Bacteroidales bacterium]|nr:ABC transporter permease subunit [Bacteroidales bacterium]
LLHFILFFLVVLVTSRLNITVPGFSTDYLYQFPNIWGFFPWVASWFNLLLAILIIVMTGNEYTFRTFRQHVVDGFSRSQLLSGKGFLILMIGVYSLLMVLLFSLVFGFIFSSDYSDGAFFNKTYIMLVYFVQAIAYMSAGFFLAILFRNTALAIVLFILYRLIIEPVFRLFFPPEARMYFPMKVISNLTPMPEFLSISSGNKQGTDGVDNLSFREMGLMAEDLPVYLNLLLALGYTAIFISLAYLLLRKRNL